MKIDEQVPTALLPYPDAQQYLGGISRSTLKTLAASGAIRSIAIGTRRLFPREELDRYIAASLEKA
jgi:excisionase family DNA binding protein